MIINIAHFSENCPVKAKISSAKGFLLRFFEFSSKRRTKVKEGQGWKEGLSFQKKDIWQVRMTIRVRWAGAVVGFSVRCGTGCLTPCYHRRRGAVGYKNIDVSWLRTSRWYKRCCKVRRTGILHFTSSFAPVCITLRPNFITFGSK